jgi:hypothetical protein
VRVCGGSEGSLLLLLVRRMQRARVHGRDGRLQQRRRRER